MSLAPWTVFDVLILEINFGEGGQDSKNFVEELTDAYFNYAKILKFSTDIILRENGHNIIKIGGKKVWGAFKWETGKHVCCRIPSNERNGRKHTSVISVVVLPLPPVEKKDELKEIDLEVAFQTGHQKAGGTNTNKVASACRMKHKPTGLSVFINGRDQIHNRKEALQILTAKVNELHNKKTFGEYNQQRKELVNTKRGDKIRTYNFSESRIVDHQLGTKTHNIKEFMKGNLNLILKNSK